MASELITGFAGKPHVGSDDMGAFQAGILGTGSYVLQTGQQLKATVSSANKVTIGTGDLVMNGRHVRMATATDLTIQNGTQGQKRNDLIVCRYSKASDGKETATLTVVKGTATTGTPADPSYNKTSILDGASVSDMPLYRIPITNLSVCTPVQLFKVLTPLDTVGDSVTQHDIIAKNYFPDSMRIEGYGANGHGFIHVSGSNVVTKREKDSIIAGILDDDAKPRFNVVTLFGVQGEAWGLISVSDLGVNVVHRYGPESLTWGYVDISIAW